MVAKPLEQLALFIQNGNNRMASGAFQVVSSRKLRECFYMNDASDRACVRLIWRHDGGDGGDY
jgi:hypothetical protein